jgi:hypothetical protein
MLIHYNDKSSKRLETIMQHSALSIISLLGFWTLFNCPVKAQSQKEYIYHGEKLVAVESCSYTLSATSANFSAAEGIGSFNVTAQGPCSWFAASNDAWITIMGGSGNGNGTVSYSVAANDQDARTGTISIAGQSFTIIQATGSVPQPTCLTFDPVMGFAGVDPSNLDICNGANMSVWVRYNFTPWPGRPEEAMIGIEDFAGTTDSTGRIVRNPLPQDTIPGTSVVTAIRNSLNSEWYQLPTPYPQFVTRPAKPTSFLINGSTSFTVNLPGTTSESAGNSQNQEVNAEYHMTQPNSGPNGSFSFPMNSNGQYPSDLHPCEVGDTSYGFTGVRNQLDSDPIAWTTVNTNLTYSRGSTCPDFAITPYSPTITVSNPGQPTHHQLSISPIREFAYPISLSVKDLPSGVTGTFSPNPVNPSQISTLTINTPSYLAPGNYNFSVTASVEDINSGGYFSRSTPATLYVPPQPTCFGYNSTIGFAGIDPSHMYACDAPNMTVEVQYTWESWTGGSSQGEDIAGTTDAAGWIYRWLPQNTAPGTSYITAYRNALRTDWVVLSPPYPQFKVRPPKPTEFMVAPATLQLPGEQWISAGNEQYQTIVEEAQNPNPPGGSAEYALGLDQFGYWSTSLPCDVIIPGTYVFNKVRNQLDPGEDAWLGLSGKTQTIVACQP